MSDVAHDPVHRPAHYMGAGLEVIDVIEAWRLGFHLGNAVKYVLRAGRKGDAREDLGKAVWYLRRAAGRSRLREPLLIDTPQPGVVPLADVLRAFAIDAHSARAAVLRGIEAIACLDWYSPLIADSLDACAEGLQMACNASATAPTADCRLPIADCRPATAAGDRP